MSFYDLVSGIIYGKEEDVLWRTAEERERTLQFVDQELNNYQKNRLDINRAVYLASSAIYRDPFVGPVVNDSHPIVCHIIRKYKAIIHAEVSGRHAEVFANLPSADTFERWCMERVENDSSNLHHPLFNFLQTEADLPQLKQFFLQESPFDMYFSDLIASMQPGHYGSKREEMLENFWDEMGHGDKNLFHRNMRVRMMEEFEIPTDLHVDKIETFDLSQLVLANYYLVSAHSRRGQLELVGMMLATECMVPGRLEKQIGGWLRNGASKAQIQYLVEHVHVDEEHAKGWMNNVVLPLVKKRPESIKQIVLGMLMRLDAASDVCDSMYSYLKA